jgi:FAD/FMN-containing dehydrogenase
VLARGGRDDLPYQLHATAEQFAQAYPQARQLRALKAVVDPQNRFSNELWRRYL